MRSRYDNESSPDPVWTQFFYDQQHRPVKTMYPDSTTDTVVFVDEFTTDAFDARGAKVRAIKDPVGHVVKTITYDTAGSRLDSVLTSYGRWGKATQGVDARGLVTTSTYDTRGRLTETTHPDIGTNHIWYNDRGQVRFGRANSESDYTYYKYDGDRRLIEIGAISNPSLDSIEVSTYPTSGASATVHFRWDTYSDATSAADTAGGLGFCLARITEMVDSSGFTKYYYDGRGRVCLKWTYIVGRSDTLKFRYEYYANDELKQITYPDGTSAKYAVDRAGRVSQITGKSADSIPYEYTLLSQVVYEPWGPVRTTVRMDTLKTSRDYDAMGHLTRDRNWIRTGNLYSRWFSYNDGLIRTEYSIDSLGDTASVGTVRRYAYDSRGRLQQAYLWDPLGSAPADTVRYDYDDNGNLSQLIMKSLGDNQVARVALLQQFQGTNCDSMLIFGGDSCFVYDKDARGRITTITAYGSYPYTPSLWLHKKQFTYNRQNLLTKVVLSKRVYSPECDGPDSLVFVYNGRGERVKTTHWYHTWSWQEEALGGGTGAGGGGGGGYWECSERTKVYYAAWSNGSIAWEERDNTGSGSSTMHHVYGLGQRLATVDGALNQTGASISQYVCDAQGTVRSYVGGSQGQIYSRLREYYPYGMEYSVIGGDPRFAFISKEDPGAGTLDFGPRHYEPFTGRFLTPDPLLAEASPYSYGHANPILFYDPTGTQSAPPPPVAYSNPNAMTMLIIQADREFVIQEIRRALETLREETVHRAISGGGGNSAPNQSGGTGDGSSSGGSSSSQGSSNSQGGSSSQGGNQGYVGATGNGIPNQPGAPDYIPPNMGAYEDNDGHWVSANPDGTVSYWTNTTIPVTPQGPSYDLDDVSVFSAMLSVGGSRYSYNGSQLCNKSSWIDAKGVRRSTSSLEKLANGKWPRGVQGIRNSYNSAARLARPFKAFGGALSVILYCSPLVRSVS